MKAHSEELTGEEQKETEKKTPYSRADCPPHIASYCNGAFFHDTHSSQLTG